MGECRCSQHVRGIRADSAQGVAPGQPLIGAVTFSDAADTFRGSAEIYGLLNETQSMVEDFVAGLAEPEEDAATVVELVKRGDSWHISIRAGELYCENAEPSWEAAVACVARILGEKPPCRIDDPEALAKLTPARVRAYLKGKGWTTSRFSVGEPWFESPPRADGCKCLLQPGNHSRADTLAAISEHESRSAAAVYLDILAAEPGA